MKGNRFTFVFLVGIFWKAMGIIWEGVDVGCHGSHIFLDASLPRPAPRAYAKIGEHREPKLVTGGNGIHRGLSFIIVLPFFFFVQKEPR